MAWSWLKAIEDDNGLNESIHILFDIVSTNTESVESENTRYLFLQCWLNNQVLSCNLAAFPIMGNPHGPGGTWRQGLLTYRATRMTAKSSTTMPVCVVASSHTQSNEKRRSTEVLKLKGRTGAEKHPFIELRIVAKYH